MYDKPVVKCFTARYACSELACRDNDDGDEEILQLGGDDVEVWSLLDYVCYVITHVG